jgi:hypothetical protein
LKNSSKGNADLIMSVAAALLQLAAPTYAVPQLSGVRLLSASVEPQQHGSLPITISSRAKVSPLPGGYYPWYQVAVDPQDPHRLIVCGSRWDAANNALYGFVYSSADSGKSWRVAIEDKNSAWVSEQSCAIALNGKAYFISEASKVIDGRVHHFLGRTRVFVSDNAGYSWAEAAQADWADYSTSVVDTHSGPERARLYTFFNYRPLSSDDDRNIDADNVRSGLGLFTYRNGDEAVNGPVVSDRISPVQRYALPEASFQLNDGKLLTLYATALSREKRIEWIIAAVRTDPKSLSMSRPTIAARVETTADDPCMWRPLDAAAYDVRRNQVYLAYRDIHCRYVLATSEDDGTTWSTGKELPRPNTRSHDYFAPAMAFNRNGILGIIWRDDIFSDCWYFAASSDRGTSFTSPLALSQCASQPATPTVTSSAFLHSLGFIWRPTKPESTWPLALSVLNYGNTVWRDNGALAASNNGDFHPVWIESGNGEGQLRTATIAVDSSSQRYGSQVLMLDSDKTCDITQHLAIVYGGDQSYDLSTSTLNVQVALKNNSLQPLRAPIVLKAETLTSKVLKLEIANADNRLPGPGAIWDLTPALTDGLLNPGSISRPYLLQFHATPIQGGLAEELLSMKLNAYSCIPMLKEPHIPRPVISH